MGETRFNSYYGEIKRWFDISLIKKKAIYIRTIFGGGVFRPGSRKVRDVIKRRSINRARRSQPEKSSRKTGVGTREKRARAVIFHGGELAN